MINSRQNKEFPSLELCKKIGHLFPDARWWWTTYPVYEIDAKGMKSTNKVEWSVQDKFQANIPAPTVVEMLERLPRMGYIWLRPDGRYKIDYPQEKIIMAETLPNALALTLAHLDKEGVSKPTTNKLNNIKE